MKYLYNGLEVQDINEIWDKETYPYAHLEKRDTEWGAYYWLILCSKPGVFDGEYITFSPPFNYAEWEYTESQEWVDISLGWGTENAVLGEWFQHSDAESELYGWGISPERIDWFSYDVLSTDGSVFIPTSDPVPVPVLSIDHTAMVQGWIVGKRLAAMRKRKPVAYLYNGERYQDVNKVWPDKEIYPYALIHVPSLFVPPPDLSDALLVFSDTPFRMDADGYFDDTVKKWTRLETDENRSWVPYSSGGDASGTSAYQPLTGIVVWSNHNIYNEDGTLYLAASEPVPVYE